jgi:hypothetical protein
VEKRSVGTVGKSEGFVTVMYPTGQHNSIHIQGPKDSSLVMTAYLGPIMKHIYIIAIKSEDMN